MERRPYVLLLVSMAVAACGPEADPAPAADPAGLQVDPVQGQVAPGRGLDSVTPTFATHIAPILYGKCAACHRPGEPAPFSLLSYEDARRKSRQIARVTESGFMPPWLPEDDHFEGDRRLTAEERELIARWAAEGAPRGEARNEPEPPTFPNGWQLREPDLVLRPSAPFRVPADGPDLLHNIVLPHGQSSLRYVEAIEIRPGNRAVHHAILAADSTSESKRLDAAHKGLGFPGMAMGNALPPDGHFLGWTPGKSVTVAEAGMAWQLRPGHDLVLQLHLTPTGKSEDIAPEVGLFFTDQPTAVRPEAIVLHSEAIDIPAGVMAHEIADELVLPVPVVLHALYPHAHYLCTRMRAVADTPGGGSRVLLTIDDWSFDWQDEFTFLTPVSLSAGTRLRFVYTYDNSSRNPSNPHEPPQRVTFGQESTDEMATLSLTVTVADERARAALKAAVLRRDLIKKPWDYTLHARLSKVLREGGDLRGARASAAAALELKSDFAEGHSELGQCALAEGDFDAAQRSLRTALALDKSDLSAHMYLGEALARVGQTVEAIDHFERALQAYPNLPSLQNNLATARLQEGDTDGALRHYARAIELEPTYFNAHFNRGRVLAMEGRTEEARSALEGALALRPNESAVQRALASLPR